MSPPVLLIRPWSPADATAVREMHAELQRYEKVLRPSRSVRSSATEAYVADLEATHANADDDTGFFVAERDGRLVGFAFCLAERDLLEAEPCQVYLQDLMVTADARVQGVGRALVAQVFTFARARGVSRVDVMVLANNQDALAAYRAFGFAPAYVTLQVELGEAD